MRQRTRQRVLLTVAMLCLLTGCPPEETIRVVGSTPNDGAAGVAVDTALVLHFDVAADPTSLDVEIEPETGLTVAWSADGRTATLVPTTTLAPSTRYDVTVWDVEPAGGGSIEAEYRFSFTTAAATADSFYREAMRAFVVAIADHARATIPEFIVVPQNGETLLTVGGTPAGTLSADYVDAIDGQGREDLLYGYEADDEPTPPGVSDAMAAQLGVAEAAGVEALVTDYCWSPARVADSYARNAAQDFTSFAAPRRDLDTIPPDAPRNENDLDVTALGEARNFLYLLDPGAFATRGDYLAALDATNYDLLIVDAFYDGAMLTPAETLALRTKPGGSARLVLAYLSIGEAEDYRDYWQPAWTPGNPSWLVAENPDWAGNYKVRYWDPAWQAIIYGAPGACLDRILAVGFDGVYLDIIDAYEYFEVLP